MYKKSQFVFPPLWVLASTMVLSACGGGDEASEVLVKNVQASASFSFSGQFEAGQEIVSTVAVHDVNGIENATLSYQWYNQTGQISGATTPSIQLTNEHVEQAIYLAVSFVDDLGFSELLTSSSYAVSAKLSASVLLEGNSFEDQSLVAVPTVSITGGEYSYQWSRAGEEIFQATSNTYLLTAEDIDKKVSVELSYTVNGKTVVVESDFSNSVVHVNHPAVGSVSISGDVEEQSTVTAVLQANDADGIENMSVTYQWFDESGEINGATANSLALQPSDNGKNIHVEVSFIDDLGAEESFSSANTIVKNKPEMLMVSSDGYEMYITKSEDLGDTWLASESILPNNGDEDYYPEVATDNKGNIVAVWEFYDSAYDVMYSYSHDNGATWSPRAQLNPDGDIDNLDASRPDIATDGEGTWVAIWGTEEDIQGSGAGDSDIAYQISKDNGKTWGDTTLLNAFGKNTPSSRNSDPVIIIKEQLWLVTWYSNFDLDGGASTDRDILYSYSEDKGGTWSVPAYLNHQASVDSSTDYFVKVDMNDSGFGVAAWAGKGTGVDDLDIWAATTSDFGKTWTDAKRINNYGATDSTSDQDYADSVVVTPDNIAVITWHGENPTFGGEDDVYYSVSTDLGLNWSEEVALNPNADSDSQIEESAMLTYTPEGTWIVNWHNQNEYDTWMSTSTDLVTWTTPVKVLDNSYSQSVILFH
ncbi:exo-alpha-sialidase [Agarivorans sp. 1_MG-2023]|uniref:exo-alpha-sialidase n=1 Tax=Agarivorans sp. 1_MG-2023 TaxID=3062634 RepID=UPI0026E43492|nr:exo-alpha-sialidase [Agarivorans sp. 1_MG-2023]MDO6762615.1 exo-alpha-sialidase [Agarivorans sp. 1_MG-2023]